MLNTSDEGCSSGCVVYSGFVAWNHRLEMWLSLKYPMKRSMRAQLAKLYWELSGTTCPCGP